MNKEKRKSFLYTRLAASNLKRNSRFYLPYIIACTVNVMMFYIMRYLVGSDAGRVHIGLTTMLGFGCVVIAIFAAILLFYTNGFLMKRRKREIGLYNILGMEKKHIARMLSLETLYTAVISIAGGILLGILFSKLVLLLLGKVMRYDIDFGFSVSGSDIKITIMLFAVIFSLVLLWNICCIHIADPAELLSASSAGEQEPKAKWPLVLCGIVTLGAGYIIAVMIKKPLAALGMFFIAVILVIIGTYCLFTACSIAALKAMKRNKRFYYRLKNFTTISGMLYRMKQNAVGLANICILSTMVLVTVSTTVSFYIGMEDSIRGSYPHEINVFAREIDDNTPEKVYALMENVLEKHGLTVTDSQILRYNVKEMTMEDNVVNDFSKSQDDKGHDLYIGIDVAGIKDGDSPDIFTYIRHDFNEAIGTYAAEALGAEATAGDIGTAADPEQGTTDPGYGSITFESLRVETRAENRDDFISTYGGFFFLGVFLGTLFMAAAVLIIYYKQISEGYDDKARFEIMQKVGMSASEVKSTIRRQVLMVFFLPLAMAVIHLAFAFNMISKLLVLFNFTDTGLFLACTAVTAGIFALLYGLVYAATARVYYRIVE